MDIRTFLAAKLSGDGTAHEIPNVLLQRQDGKLVRLYDDVIKGKIALINFFYTTCSGVCGLTTSNLVKVQDRFGDRLGRDVVMVSVSIDPRTDTPKVLNAYCRRHGTKAGWHFVTGTPSDIELLRSRLGLRDRDNPANTHTALVVYGNADAEQWAVMPALADPESIVTNVIRLTDLAN